MGAIGHVDPLVALLSGALERAAFAGARTGVRRVRAPLWVHLVETPMHRRCWNWTLVGGVAALVVATPPAALAQSRGAPGPLVVVVVRHAEKAPVPGNDPPLSAAGDVRARALAATLRDANVTAVVVSQWQRTRQTAAPMASARGLTPVVVAAGADVAGHAAAVASAVRRHSGTVLVVGHSNTVGPIVAALGGPATVRVCDAQYATLLTVVPNDAGAARLVRSAYGAADPAVDERCELVAPGARSR